MEKPDLQTPDYYINRELSLLEFNSRVLAQAENPDIPLLERLKFLCILANNLDEFFEVRVAGIKQKVEYGAVRCGPDGLTPTEELQRISVAAHALMERQYRTLNDSVIPQLDAEGIRFLKRAHWNPVQGEWLESHFVNELLPVLSPVGLDPAHPFPRVLNKSLNFIVTLEGKDAFGRSSGKAIVQAPRSLPRLVLLPEDCRERPRDFVFLSSIIHAFVGQLFPGMQVTGCYQFRCTRNSDLFIDDEEVEDLLAALAGELPSRRFGDAVRLEVTAECPGELTAFLLSKFALQDLDLYRCNGPVSLNRLMMVYGQADRPDLCYKGFTPALPKSLARTGTDIFAVIGKRDLLLHHPFESFTPVIDFLKQAAHDEQVLAIRQTLYRTGVQSAVVQALVEAARRGKEVTVVIELRARFDEEANIGLANLLQEAGAHVVYGVVGHKTHAKMILAIRRENQMLRRYAHLSTGNYHASTARLYTDLGLFTSDPDITEDVQKIFQQMMALGRSERLKCVLQSPFTLHRIMLKLIDREVENAKAGKQARIIAKMNSLEEPTIIEALYEASRAGVNIHLIVRGVCVLRPGIEGVSENISVRSIIGRFLEHSRIFYFLNDGEFEIYLSSADWMDRNFFSRLEVCTPIRDRKLKKRVFSELLESYLDGHVRAWELQSDGSYRWTAGEAGSVCIQEQLLEKLADY